MSPEARTALAWMRDTPHYAARWLIGRKVPATQLPQEWTHIGKSQASEGYWAWARHTSVDPDVLP